MPGLPPPSPPAGCSGAGSTWTSSRWGDTQLPLTPTQLPLTTTQLPLTPTQLPLKPTQLPLTPTQLPLTPTYIPFFVRPKRFSDIRQMWGSGKCHSMISRENLSTKCRKKKKEVRGRKRGTWTVMRWCLSPCPCLGSCLSVNSLVSLSFLYLGIRPLILPTVFFDPFWFWRDSSCVSLVSAVVTSQKVI